jgi:hypothetical protein
LIKYYNSEKVTLTVIEAEHFLEFLRVFISIFIPYVSTCIQALFPDGQLARELGVSILDISEKSKLNRIDIDQIIEPIKTITDSVIRKKIPSPENVPEEVENIPIGSKEEEEEKKQDVDDEQEEQSDVTE